MPPLTLTSQRFGALQRAPVRFCRDNLPLRSAPPSFERRRRTEKGSIVVASALDDGVVASTTSSSTSSSLSSPKRGSIVVASALDGNAVASTSSSLSSSSAIADAKASLRAAAPAARSGDPAAVAKVLAAVERLAELAAASSSTPVLYPPPPEPSVWETLYTNAQQGSNGKVGPLQGEARQLFDAGNKFLNRVSIPSDALPLLRADFGGRWEQRAGRADRVEVIFEKSAFYVLGGLLRVAGSEFPPPGQKGSLKGHWTMKFADDDVRAFVTNKLSVVVLGRVEEGKGKE